MARLRDFVAVRAGLLALAMGCSVVPPASEDPDLCQAASDHVADCLGTPSSAPGDCDQQAAAELLDLSCEAMADGKADAVASALCAVGLLRHCPVPECVQALPPTTDFLAADCSTLLDVEGCTACDYYRCREAQSIGQCDEEGYYTGFGYKYCVRYAQMTESHLSEAGQAWSASTRACLLKSLQDNVEDSGDCAALVAAGYATHAECYRETGFCDLSLSDVRRVASTIDPVDLDLAQALEVALDCFAD